MISCKKATEIISRSYEEPIGWRDCFELYKHLFICNLCRRFKAQLRFLRKAARKFKSGNWPAEAGKLPDGFKERLRQILKD